MQQIINFVLAAIFILAIIRQCLYWSWLWQLKEYRIDKLRSHFYDIGFGSTLLALIGYSSLRQYIYPKFTAKSLTIVILSLLSGISLMAFVYKFYFSGIFLALSSVILNSRIDFVLLVNSINHPTVINLALTILKFLSDYGVIMAVMAAIFIFMPDIILIYVIILNVLSGFSKAVTIARARMKISKYPNLKVVGVTGSYGKSTTKEILADILSKKYKVLKTPVNNNTAIGIAQLILSKLDENCEIFVVEMGAYKIGEIKEICDMVRPQIGIITAINEQHLALFGTIENTIKAKFELVDCLPDTGLAILNIGDANIQAGMESRSTSDRKIKAKVKLYSVGAKADVYTIGEACGRQSVKFKYISGAKMKDFIVNITGCHNTSNALAAIIAAEDLNMDLDQISLILQKNNYLDIALKNLAGPNGSTLIDDTYNANPDGVIAALNHTKSQRGRKIVVMSSLIELGSRAHEIHEKLGKEISQIAAKAYFLDNYYISDIRKGAAKNEGADIEIIKERNASKISEDLKKELRPTDTVLFINRGAAKILELLK
jgi:UDP-N-acetylmuramoyl-tripeptide--D-alanyl-D-alanine ligase